MGKVRLPYSQAKSLTDRIVEALRPGCARIAVAGSIRRERSVIGDIEIVAIPEYQRDLFGEVAPDLPTKLDAILGDLVAGGRISPPVKNGPNYKQFNIPGCNGLNLDLFITNPECWGVIFAIRTGSAAFSKKLVTQRNKGGFLPSDCIVSGGRIWRNGKALATPEEKDVFDLIGGWVPPQERN